MVPGGYEDAGETARKIRQGIEAKASKYKSLPDPLVVLALYAGNDVDHQDLENALFAAEMGSGLNGVLVNHAPEPIPAPNRNSIFLCRW